MSPEQNSSLDPKEDFGPRPESVAGSDKSLLDIPDAELNPAALIRKHNIEQYMRRKEKRDADRRERLKTLRWVFIEVFHPEKKPIDIGGSSGKERTVGPLGFYQLNFIEIQKLSARRRVCRWVVLPEGTTPSDVKVEKISDTVAMLSPAKAAAKAKELVDKATGQAKKG